MAWVKRPKGGLWSDALTDKVNNSENICYLASNDVHKMHHGIKHVVASFEEVHEAFKNQKDDNVKMYTPMEHLNIIMRINNPRIMNNGITLGKPTEDTAPFLFNSKGRCKVKLKDLAICHLLYKLLPLCYGEERRLTLI